VRCCFRTAYCFALFYFVINACISHVIITLIRYLLTQNPGICSFIIPPEILGLKNGPGPGSRDCNPYVTLSVCAECRMPCSINIISVLRGQLTISVTKPYYKARHKIKPTVFTAFHSLKWYSILTVSVRLCIFWANLATNEITTHTKTIKPHELDSLPNFLPKLPEQTTF